MSEVLVLQQPGQTMVLAFGQGSAGGSNSVPTGTGFRHITADEEDATVASDAVFKAAVLVALGITTWTKTGTTINVTGSGGLDITLG